MACAPGARSAASGETTPFSAESGAADAEDDGVVPLVHVAGVYSMWKSLRSVAVAPSSHSHERASSKTTSRDTWQRYVMGSKSL